MGLPGDDRPIIGNVARLHPVKDHVLLLDAFALVREQRPDAYLVIVGDGPCRPALEDRIRRLGLREHVLLAGVQPDPAAILRQFDVFALSSITEGTSMSVLEAMATSLPVVATAVGGTPALLRNGDCGLLVSHGDPAALAAGLLKVLDEPDLGQQLGRRARAEVEAHHSHDVVADAYEQIYALVRATASSPQPAS